SLHPFPTRRSSDLLQANSRYLTALAEVENPTDAIRTLDRITTRKQVAPKRTAKAFNPLARDETQIFRALLDGQHMIRGFSNPDIRQKLQDSPHLKNITGLFRRSTMLLAMAPFPFSCSIPSKS